MTESNLAMIGFILILAILIFFHIYNGRRRKYTNIIGRFVSTMIEEATNKNNNKLNDSKESKRRKVKMETTNLVMGEAVRDVVQFSDDLNNARMLETIRLTFDPAKLLAEIVEIRTWESPNPEDPNAPFVGTEVEVLSTPLIEGTDRLGIEGDPLPGAPEGLVRLEKDIITTSAATHGSFVSTTIEAVAG